MKTFSDAQQYTAFLGVAKQFAARAKEAISAGEEIPTTAFLLKTRLDGKFEVAIVPLNGLPSKNLVKPIIQQLTGELGTTGVALVTDAYVAPLKEGDPAMGEIAQGVSQVRDLPGRQEALITTLEMKEGITHMIIERYTRNDSGEIVWDAPEESYTDEDIGTPNTGRMSGFFS